MIKFQLINYRHQVPAFGKIGDFEVASLKISEGHLQHEI